MRSQLEFQAVVVPMDEPDPSGGLRKIALFNQDGTPFMGGDGGPGGPLAITIDDVPGLREELDSKANAASGGGNMILTLSRPGALSEGAEGVGTIRIPVTRDCQIIRMRAMTGVGGEPTDEELIVDVNRGDADSPATTLFTTQAERPTVAIDDYDSGEAVPDVTELFAGDWLTLDVDQHGGATGVTVSIEVA